MDSFNLNNNENELENKRLKIKYDYLGNKTMLLFWIQIATIAISILSIIVMLIVTLIFYPEDYTLPFTIGLSVFSLAAMLLFGITTIKMGDFDGDFTTAGVLYLIGQGLSLVETFLPDDSCFGTILKLGSSILMLIHTLKFATAMESQSYQASAHISDLWTTYKKVFIGITIATIVCSFCLFIPILNILAVIVLIIIAIATLIVNIWELILFYKTASAMKKFK